ncbi:MAG: tetratricopeptide repeat protein [Candidatus Heimdallarchaeota archaeon]
MNVLQNLRVTTWRGNNEAAEPLFRQSLEIFKQENDQINIATTHLHLPRIYQERGDYGQAED